MKKSHIFFLAAVLKVFGVNAKRDEQPTMRSEEDLQKFLSPVEEGTLLAGKNGPPSVDPMTVSRIEDSNNKIGEKLEEFQLQFDEKMKGVEEMRRQLSSLVNMMHEKKNA